MGLVLPQTVKVRTNGSNCKYFREKGYEFKKCGDFIEVNVLDLKKGSTVKVKYKCDFCGKETEVLYGDVSKAEKNNTFITCKDKSCTQLKYKNTCKKRFKVEYPAQCQEIKDKTKATCQERFGVDNPSKSQEVKDKKKKTWQLHYGVDNPNQSTEVRNKFAKTLKENYGEDIINPFQVESVKDKIKATNKEKYGVDWYVQSNDFKDKSKITNKKKYGVEYCSQTQEVKDKVKATCQKRFGVDHPSKSQEVKDKVRVTCQTNWGVNNPMQCDEIKNKALETFQFNGTGPCSRAQKYIQILTNGILNKSLCGFLTDIYFEDKKIVIEYDGSGHFLTDIFNGNKTPSKESLLREKEREDKIINNGYRMIRFIATKDRIPSDEVILNLINEFKNSDFKVIRINFEEGTIEKDYKEKSHRIFGELRKITQKDLEQFESKK